MNIRVFDSAADLASAAAAYLVRRLEKSPEATVALSGGSTPRLMYDILGGGIARSEIANARVTWIMGDERCVPPEDPKSNARMIRETLFREGIPEGHRWLGFATELGDPEAIASRFEKDWRRLGIHEIDVAFLGLGEDGHTASLFPGTSVLTVEDRIAAPVYVPSLDSWRVTLTLPVLRKVRSRIILATGASKRAVVDQARRLEPIPIVLAGGTEDHSWWFIDRDAYPES